MRSYAFLFIILIGIFSVVPEAAAALPEYAKGGVNLKAAIESKGKAITDIASLILAVCSILGIIIGATMIGTGQADRGKSWVIGGVAGLIIGGTVYGIAALVT
jgi:hypothetical protein